MSEEPEIICECGNKMTKLFGGGSGIIFKGSGFYVNDYKKPRAVSKSAKEEAEKL